MDGVVLLLFIVVTAKMYISLIITLKNKRFPDVTVTCWDIYENTQTHHNYFHVILRNVPCFYVSG